jgi:hypothetical protein
MPLETIPAAEQSGFRRHRHFREHKRSQAGLIHHEEHIGFHHNGKRVHAGKVPMYHVKEEERKKRTFLSPNSQGIPTESAPPKKKQYTGWLIVGAMVAAIAVGIVAA